MVRKTDRRVTVVLHIVPKIFKKMHDHFVEEKLKEELLEYFPMSHTYRSDEPFDWEKLMDYFNIFPILCITFIRVLIYFLFYA